MALFRRARFVRTRDGHYRVRLEPEERALLATLPDQLSSLLAESSDPGATATSRLFPPAYTDDGERDAEYQRLMRSELVGQRLARLATMRETIDATQLTDDQLQAWVKVLNDVRLILGTLLDVSEETSEALDLLDPSAPDASQRVIYYVLTGLVDEAVTALSGGLPAPTAL